MTDCKCDLGNIIDEETFNVRVIRELCNISNSVGSTELLRMVDQTDDGDVQFIRTSNGDFELDGETSYTPIGEVKPYKRDDAPHIVLPYCYLNESPVPTDITVDTNWSKFSLSVSIDQDCFVYGARTTSSATDKLELRAVNSAVRFNTTIGSNSAAYSYVTDLSSRTDMTNNGTNITTTNSGTTNTVSVGSTPGFVACPYPVCIGGMQTGSSITATLRMKGYFWKNEIEINNVLVHKIIPVKMKSDNSICLYDEITKKYYTAVSGTTILEERPAPAPVDDGVLRFTIDTNYGKNFGFTVSGATDYIVDWGDGTTNTGTNLHTYTNSDIYHVTITKGGSNNFPKVTFSNSEIITSVDSPIPFMNGVTSLNGVLSGCIHVTSFDENLFYFNPQLTTVGTIISNNDLITSLPANLMKPLVNLTSLISGFGGLHNLESIPNGFLDNCTKIKRFYRCFRNCTNLVTIPELLFKNNIEANDFNQCFMNCNKLTIPQNLFCDDSTERSTRFVGLGYVDFDSCFMRSSYTGSATMTVPTLWDYTFDSTPGRWGCYGGAGNSATNITNYSSIPNPWNAS